MRNNTGIGVALLTSALVSGVVIGHILDSLPVVSAQSNDPVFELRTYTANDGQLDGMVKELEFASLIFERLGMENVGYWVPTDSPLSENTLIYILKHESRDAAAASWDVLCNTVPAVSDTWYRQSTHRQRWCVSIG